MKINSFKINNLHGALTYELKLQDNTLILIGENGSCKTTIIKLLFYTLSMQWGKLSQYNFDSITFNVNDYDVKITKRDIDSMIMINNSTLHRFPSSIRNEILSITRSGDIFDSERIDFLCKKYNIPISYLMRELEFGGDLFSENQSTKASVNIKKAIAKIKECFEGIHIIYLPTYRRIEQELKVVLDGRFEENEYRTKRLPNRFRNANFSELVEFGMDDVDEATNKSLNELKDFFRNSLNQMTLGYLGDVVDKKYQDLNTESLANIDELTIENIMQRVDESILSNERKKTLSKSIEQIKSEGVISVHDQVVCHYFKKLLSSHRELETKEVKIRKFAEICSKYLKNKSISYDSSNFTFSINSNIENQTIKFHQLSSGEKQIVSLFSHLYLDGEKKYFVLIDEPELSLSVKWQKEFLADINKGDFCSGIVAVTHSPFIFDNKLDIYAHAVEEFIK
jgi:predicted ATP-dependent endonuclease of OLD family